MHKTAQPRHAVIHGKITLQLAVLVLLLANAAFLGWMQYGALIRAKSTEAHLIEQQINRDAVHLLTPQQVAALAEQQGTGTVKVAATVNSAAPAACLEWGAFNAADVAKAEEALAALALGNRLGRRRIEETAAYWVFLPPQPSRQAAQQRVAELKLLGVAEYFIVQEDSTFRFAVSLGVFRTEEAARTHLAQLRAKGIKTAQVGPRDAQVQHVYFQVRDVPDTLRAKLIELELSFPGTDLKDCGGLPDVSKPAAPAAASVPVTPAVPAPKVAPKAAPKAAPKDGA